MRLYKRTPAPRGQKQTVRVIQDRINVLRVLVIVHNMRQKGKYRAAGCLVLTDNPNAHDLPGQRVHLEQYVFLFEALISLLFPSTL